MTANNNDRVFKRDIVFPSFFLLVFFAFSIPHLFLFEPQLGDQLAFEDVPVTCLHVFLFSIRHFRFF